MCLDLRNSKYRNINEIEFLLKYDTRKQDIIAAKDSRRDIKRLLRIAQQVKELYDLY